MCDLSGIRGHLYGSIFPMEHFGSGDISVPYSGVIKWWVILGRCGTFGRVGPKILGVDKTPLLIH